MKFSVYAASILSLMLAEAAAAGPDDMDVHTVKGKDGKQYFCANATCAGQSNCMGAGNAVCGGKNKCASTDQKHLSGWFYADSKEECEKGPGKWVLFKKEYGFKTGNKPPLPHEKPRPKKT